MVGAPSTVKPRRLHGAAAGCSDNAWVHQARSPRPQCTKGRRKRLAWASAGHSSGHDWRPGEGEKPPLCRNTVDAAKARGGAWVRAELTTNRVVRRVSETQACKAAGKQGMGPVASWLMSSVRAIGWCFKPGITGATGRSVGRRHRASERSRTSQRQFEATRGRPIVMQAPVAQRAAASNRQRARRRHVQDARGRAECVEGLPSDSELTWRPG